VSEALLRIRTWTISRHSCILKVKGVEEANFLICVVYRILRQIRTGILFSNDSIKSMPPYAISCYCDCIQQKHSLELQQSSPWKPGFQPRTTIPIESDYLGVPFHITRSSQNALKYWFAIYHRWMSSLMNALYWRYWVQCPFPFFFAAPRFTLFFFCNPET